MKRQIDDDDDILKDGERRSFSMRMMDAVQRSVAAAAAPVVDASGDPLGLHRPGYRLPAPGTAAHDAAEIADAVRLTRRAMLGCTSTAPVLSLADARARNDKARADHIAALTDAWRTPPPKPAA